MLELSKDCEQEKRWTEKKFEGYWSISTEWEKKNIKCAGSFYLGNGKKA